MRDLAQKVGLSDVGLKKILKAQGIPTPPQGHWNKVHAGRTVPKRPTAAPRRPGEAHLIYVDRRFEVAFSADPPIDPDGPFSSGAVPEDLEELRASEMKALGNVRVPSDLRLPHAGLHEIVKREERLRAKKVVSSWSSGPLLESVVDKRRLRLLNGLFLALSKRGVTAKAEFRDIELQVHAIVGDMGVRIALEPANKPKNLGTYSYADEMAKLPPRNTLIFTVGVGSDQTRQERWQDDSGGLLETKIAPIAAAIIVAGEAACRRKVRSDAEWIERRRVEMEAERQRRIVEAEAERQRRIAAAEAKRLSELRRSGELLREANDIRALIGLVRGAVENSNDVLAKTHLLGWETWAAEYADRIDPIKSGQVLSHLVPPVIE